MARKGNQQRNGIDRHSSNHRKGVAHPDTSKPDIKEQAETGEVSVGARDKILNSKQCRTPSAQCGKDEGIGNDRKSKQKSLRKEKQGAVATDFLEGTLLNGSILEDGIHETSTVGASGVREENVSLPRSSHDAKCANSSLDCSENGPHTENWREKFGFPDMLAGINIRRYTFSTLKAVGEWLDSAVGGTVWTSAQFIIKASAEWVERRKPLFTAFTINILKSRDYARVKFRQAYPIFLRWLIHIGKIMLLLFMVWLDCTVRGIDSLLHLGTTSFFSVIWFSILSVIAMSGIFKFLIILVMASLLGVLVGLTLAIMVVAISGTVLLWLYGSFWTTMLVIFVGGMAFLIGQERLALLITTVYSLYCAWAYDGWIGLLLGFNLSFISSDVLVYFLKNNLNERRRPDRPQDQTAEMGGRQGFSYGDPMHASSSEMGFEHWADRSQGVPSTSGSDIEATSEDEVLRLLNCTDHYAALGLCRFETVDASILKREYKKKAMLVHPDKNMGNEKAAEAFQKLQNAYEILLDSLKRQAYDDELRREELLNYFRRFQSSSQKRGGHSLFASGFARSEADGEDLLGESRQIACRKCGNFHIWVYTKKSKSRARWCQDCKDFHPAKDGDGWVEQSLQPFFFGLLQKMDVPSAYVCAEGRIYDATEWFVCQGMRCPANTHKPSFHVNTSITSKPGGRGTGSGHRGGGMPAFNAEDGMTEEEMFAWLHNAMQAGMFGTSDGGASTQSPSAKAESCSKSGGSNSGNNSKRRKKGKKQR